MVKHVTGIQVVDVEKRREPSKHYVYVIFVTWSDGCSFVIYRRYSRFFDLQSKLLDMFPLEAGTLDPTQRCIPFLPGKIIFGRSHVREVAMKRMQPIDEYCKAIIKLPDKISHCDEVLSFFEVDSEDLDPPALASKPKTESSVEKISKPKQLDQYVAIADYEKQEKGEITLHTGMRVEVIEKSETGWWFVNAEDEQGWVPSSYVEPVSGQKEEVSMRAKPGEEEKYICVESFAPEGSDEVRLDKGAVVDVVEKNLEGWWLIRYNGREGWAPATYLMKAKEVTAQRLLEQSRNSGVEIVGNLSDVSNLIKSDDKRNSTDQHQQRAADAGDALSKVLKKRSLTRGGSLKPPPRQNSVVAQEDSQTSPRSTKSTIYVTIAEFAGQMSDGISFQSGESVQVLEKTSTGWWFVKINDKEGWAPSSFIESTSEAAEEDKADTETNRCDVDEFSDTDSETFEDDAALESRAPAERLAEALKKKKSLPPRPGQAATAASVVKGGQAGAEKSSDRKPAVAGKPLVPPKIPGGGRRSPTQPVQESSTSNQVKVSGKNWSPRDTGGDDGDRKASSRGSNLMEQLKSQLESNQRGTSRLSQEGSLDHVQSVRPSKPILPPKTGSGEPKSADLDQSHQESVKKDITNKPSLPKRPGVVEKPKLAFDKPKPPAKITSRVASPGRQEDGKTNRPATPPKLPSQPPKLPSKPTAGAQVSPDTNRNKDSDRPHPSSTQGLAAALKTKLENRPQLPVKNSGVPPGGQSGSKGRQSESKESRSEVVTGSKANVGNLISSLSGKLTFGNPGLGGGGSGGGGSNGISSSSRPSSAIQNSPHSNSSDTNRVSCVRDVFYAYASFTGESQEEVSFKEGDEMIVLDRSSSDWWLVQCDGREGWAPVGYLTQDKPLAIHMPTPAPVSNKPAAPIKPGATPVNSRQPSYKTCAFFTAENEGEIGFEEGISVAVLDKTDSGWWLISYDGQEGWAPASYIVEEVPPRVESLRGASSRPLPPPKTKTSIKPAAAANKPILPARPK